MKMKQGAFAVELSDDRKTAKFSIGAAAGPHMVTLLSAENIEGVICALAKARADMQPEIPREDPSGKVIVQHDPAFWIQQSLGEQVDILLRHPGYGWFRFEIPREEASQMKDVLTRVLDAPLPSRGPAN